MSMELIGKALAFFVLFQAYTSITCRLCDFSIESSASSWVRKPCAFYFNNKPETKYIGFEFRLRDDTAAKRAFEVVEADFNEFFHSALTPWNHSCDCTEVPCLNGEQLNKLFAFSVEQAHQEARWRFPFISTLCCSFQQALEEIVYRLDGEQVTKLTKITLKEINMQKWTTHLIDGLRQTEWCESFKAKCDAVVQRISKGCEEKRREKRDIGVKTSTMCGPSSCNHDTGSVSPTPLKSASHLGVQNLMSTSAQRYVASRSMTLVNNANQSANKLAIAPLKTSYARSENSQEMTVSELASSFLIGTALTPSPTPSPTMSWNSSTMLDLGALSSSPIMSVYTTPTMVTIARVRSLATFSKSTQSSLNSTESISKGKAIEILTASSGRPKTTSLQNAAFSESTVYLSTLSSVSHAAHLSEHLPQQNSAVEESSVNGYLATELSTPKTQVIKYSQVLITQVLSDRASMKISSSLSTLTNQAINMAISSPIKSRFQLSTSVRRVSLMNFTTSKTVSMATDVVRGNASLKSTNSALNLDNVSAFSSEQTSRPLQGETTSLYVITPSNFKRLSKSSSALDLASGESVSGQQNSETTLSVTFALAVAGKSSSLLTDVAWNETKILHQPSFSKGNKSNLLATSLLLASSSSSSSSSSSLSSPLSLHFRSSSLSSPFSPSSILTPSSVMPISSTLPPPSSNSSRMLYSFVSSTPSTLSLSLAFSLTKAVLFTQQSRVSTSQSTRTSLPLASTSPLSQWSLSSKKSHSESYMLLSLPLTSPASTTIHFPLRIRTTLLSTLKSLSSAQLSSLSPPSSSSSSSSSLTRTTMAVIGPLATPKRSSSTPSPSSVSLQLSSTDSLLSLPLMPTSPSSTTKSALLPQSIHPSSVPSLPTITEPKPSLAPTPLYVSSRLSTLPNLTLNTETPLVPQSTKHHSLLLTTLGTTQSSSLREILNSLSYTGTKTAPSSILHTLSLESSSSTPSTTLPAVTKTFLIKFKANCSIITDKDDFGFNFIATLTHLLQISTTDVIVHDVICGSVDVVFMVKSAHGRNLTSVLWAAIKNESFVFTYNGTELVAFELREIPSPSVTFTSSTMSPSTPSVTSKHERKKVVFIIFVFIGSVFAALFIFLLVVFLARFSGCCRKAGKLRVRRNGRLRPPFESELKRFAVRGSLFQGVNYYGDITQLEENRKDSVTIEDDAEEDFFEIHPVDTNTCLLNDTNHTDSNKQEECKFVFDDDESCSSVLFY